MFVELSFVLHGVLCFHCILDVLYFAMHIICVLLCILYNVLYSIQVLYFNVGVMILLLQDYFLHVGNTLISTCKYSNLY